MSGLRGCKADSGAQKRKRKKLENQMVASQKGAILAHFKKANKIEETCSQSDDVIGNISVESSIEREFFQPSTSNILLSSHSENSNSEMRIEEVEPCLLPDIDNDNNLSNINIDLSDIGLWPLTLTKNQRLAIIESGPKRNSEFKFPRNENNRHFSLLFYTRKLPNGETVDRRWLVYSEKKDVAFCFCCRLFSESKSKFCNFGCNDWKNFSKIIKDHESSTNHIHSLYKWIDLENGLKKKITIDKNLERMIDSEKLRWRGVLERLLAIVQFLCQNNLAFRGTHEKLFERNNGNFLGLVELVAQFDPLLREHLRKITNSEISDHYLGKNIQNEFIEIIQERVLKTIVTSVMKAKYFSVILDCTPDISHQEQMSMILRFVEQNGKEFQIVERFVGFFQVHETTGIGLVEILLEKLQKLGLSIDDCRGQGYDNGANMRGNKQGVQARVLDINPRAFYVPCGCHSLNLVLSDMAKSSIYTKNLFGIIQQIFVLFSASTQRWHILLNHIKILTVKPLCDTRWEARIESVKALRYQLGEIYDALVEVSETTNDAKCQTEAMSLAKELKSYKFLVMLSVWYDVLSQVNLTSKVMQSQNMDLNHSLELLEKTSLFLKEYRETGFVSAQITAKELAEQLEMSPEETVFPAKKSVRRKRVRKQFSYEADDESVCDPKEHFRVNFFITLLDQAIMSLDERFHQYQTFKEHFGFIFDVAKLKNVTDEYLKDKCINLQNVLAHKDNTTQSDIDGMILFTELKTLSNILTGDMAPVRVLQYLHETRLDEVLPNLCVVLRILLTIPVTVASAERSFSKLKLVKTYLRSTMCQERLVGISLISIENDIARSINYADLIDEFASKKARKIPL